MKGKGSGMTLQGKGERNETLRVRTSSTQPHAANTFANQTPSREEIRLRAYEIYLDRGEVPGNELDDWLQAEGELESAALRKANGSSIKAETQ